VTIIDDLRQLRLLVVLDLADGSLEANDFEISLGSYSYLLFEHADKMRSRITNVLAHAPKIDLVRPANDFGQSVLDRRIEHKAALKVFEQKSFGSSKLE